MMADNNASIPTVDDVISDSSPWMQRLTQQASERIASLTLNVGEKAVDKAESYVQKRFGLGLSDMATDPYSTMFTVWWLTSTELLVKRQILQTITDITEMSFCSELSDRTADIVGERLPKMKVYNPLSGDLVSWDTWTNLCQGKLGKQLLQRIGVLGLKGTEGAMRGILSKKLAFSMLPSPLMGGSTYMTVRLLTSAMVFSAITSGLLRSAEITLLRESPEQFFEDLMGIPPGIEPEHLAKRQQYKTVFVDTLATVPEAFEALNAQRRDLKEQHDQLWGFLYEDSDQYERLRERQTHTLAQYFHKHIELYQVLSKLGGIVATFADAHKAGYTSIDLPPGDSAILAKHKARLTKSLSSFEDMADKFSAMDDRRTAYDPKEAARRFHEQQDHDAALDEQFAHDMQRMQKRSTPKSTTSPSPSPPKKAKKKRNKKKRGSANGPDNTGK